MTERISHHCSKTPIGLRSQRATIKRVSPEMYTIIGVAMGLAALTLNGQLGTRRAIAELRQGLNELRSEMHREFAAVRNEFSAVRSEIAAVRDQVAALAERVARLEGVILGPLGFARETGTGNTM